MMDRAPGQTAIFFLLDIVMRDSFYIASKTRCSLTLQARTKKWNLQLQIFVIVFSEKKPKAIYNKWSLPLLTQTNV